MYIPEALASSLGLPFIITVLSIIGIAALLWIMHYLDSGNTGGCTGDCNQGRTCNCGPTEADKARECVNWPFPCAKQLEFPFK